jgi:nitrous oxidase accessory protein NosD/pimeloyl-ACP methyl ester carboxylesterase
MSYFYLGFDKSHISRLLTLCAVAAIALMALFYYQIAQAQSPSRIFVTESNCPQIGVWESNTCTLTGDVDIPVIIQRSGVTLDGNGYTIQAAAGLNDATISLMSPGVTVKNVIVRSTARSAINILDIAPGAIIENVIIYEPSVGIVVQARDSVIRDVSVIGGDSTSFGLRILDTENISVSGFTALEGFVGITMFGGSDVVISSSVITGSQTGVAIEFSDDVILEQSTLTDITGTGLQIGIRSEIEVRDNQIKGISSSGSEGIRLTDTGNTKNTIIVGNHISNWDIGVNDRTSYFTGGPIQMMFLDTVNSIREAIVPTAWAQVVARISLYGNNFSENTVAYNIPLEANARVSLHQNGVGNYWDTYDEADEGCVDSNGDQVCDEPYQLPASIADDFPATEPVTDPIEPIVSASCSLYVAPEVPGNQDINVRFTSVFADTIESADSVAEVDISTGSFTVTPTILGVQTISATVTGLVGSSDCTTTVLVTGEIPEPSPEPTGASSVLFLPGIQASRLYAGQDIVLPGLANNIDVGDKLWEQTNDKRLAFLAMDANGESIYDIYTKDVLDEIGLGSNIYKGFLGLLEDMKSDDKVIDNYLPFAYDWRYSVFDVATKPVQYENEVKLLKDELIKLAADSHTDKVTIVAHSNGGLVAKALLHEYGDNELKGLVDKVIMIGTPQLGTPKGISALLHGQVLDGFGGILTSDAVLRDAVNNMPGAYTLLPSERYMSEVLDGQLVTVPAGFDISVYDGVSTRAELNALLLDSQGVIGDTPSIEEPMQLNQALLNRALAEQAILDAWRPPAGVEVYEVAGTGIPTPSAVYYEKVPTVTCSSAAAVFLATGCEGEIILKPKLRTTIQGDETVVLGSARGQLGDKRTLTVNLFEEGKQRFTRQREHADLTESPIVQIFIESVIRFPYVTDEIVVPEFSQLLSGFTMHAGHSPVTLRVVTSDGLITGIVDGVVRQDISGSQFITLAGSTYIIIPDDVTDYTLEVVGTGNGVYTLETSTLSPEDVQTVIASFVASTTDTMRSTMQVVDGQMQTLQTDFDNDGTVDEVRTSGGEMVATDTSQVDVDTITPTSSSQSSATRVAGRTLVPQVLGVSVSVETLTPEQLELLQVLIIDIQQIMQENNLTASQLLVISSVLEESLLIIND